MRGGECVRECIAEWIEMEIIILWTEQWIVSMRSSLLFKWYFQFTPPTSIIAVPVCACARVWMRRACVTYEKRNERETSRISHHLRSKNYYLPATKNLSRSHAKMQLFLIFTLWRARKEKQKRIEIALSLMNSQCVWVCVWVLAVGAVSHVAHDSPSQMNSAILFLSLSFQWNHKFDCGDSIGLKKKKKKKHFYRHSVGEWRVATA